MISGKRIAGVIEKVTIQGEETVEAYAVLDSGAKVTSIDVNIAQKAKVGEPVKFMGVRSPSLKTITRRPVVRVILGVAGLKFDTEVNIQDRSHMSFPVIIGRNVLSGNLVIDPEKNEQLFYKKGIEEKIKTIKEYV